MNRKVTRRRWAAALVALAALATAGCSSAKSGGGAAPTSGSGNQGGSGATIPAPTKITGTISGPGVTASTITLGQITTTSGPVPGLFQDANFGLDAWAAYINSLGGLNGHTIKIQHVDDGFDCNSYTQAMRTMATQVFAIVGSFTLEDTCGKAVLAEYPNLVDLQATALDPTLYSIPNVYTPLPNPAGFATTGYLYFKHKFPDAITHAASLIGAPAAANGKEQQLAAKSVGYKYVYTRLFGPFETNYTSDILHMKNSGVRIVDMGAAAVGNVAAFLQQAAQQNFHPDAVISAAGYDAHLLPLLGNPSLAANLYAPLPYALYLGSDRASVPAVNTFLNWLGSAHPGVASSLFTVSAWAAGQLLYKSMQSAGSEVTQTSVLKALSGITNFNSDGLHAPTNPGAKQGAHCLLVAHVVNGQWTRANPSSGFDCAGTYFEVPLSALK